MLAAPTGGRAAGFPEIGTAAAAALPSLAYCAQMAPPGTATGLVWARKVGHDKWVQCPPVLSVQLVPFLTVWEDVPEGFHTPTPAGINGPTQVVLVVPRVWVRTSKHQRLGVGDSAIPPQEVRFHRVEVK